MFNKKEVILILSLIFLLPIIFAVNTYSDCTVYGTCNKATGGSTFTNTTNYNNITNTYTNVSNIINNNYNNYTNITYQDNTWLRNGNNIYNNNTGFVGIGTNEPQGALHVVGSIRSHVAESDNISPTYYLATPGNNRAWNIQQSADYGLAFWRFNGTTWNKEVGITPDGNITANNICYSNGTGCQSSGNSTFNYNMTQPFTSWLSTFIYNYNQTVLGGGSISYNNIALTNSSNNFSNNQYINGDLFLALNGSTNVYSTCYQETATTGVGCGGLSTGRYSSDGTWSGLGNLYDGSWSTLGYSTSGTSNLYINYTIPSSASFGTTWQVRDYGATTNLAIPSSCLSYNTQKLILRVSSKRTSPYSVNWSCYDGSWQNLRGVQSTSISYSYVYEEAINWNMSLKVNTGKALVTNNINLYSGGKIDFNNNSFGTSYLIYNPLTTSMELWANGVKQQSWGHSTEIYGNATFPDAIAISNGEIPLFMLGYNTVEDFAYLNSVYNTPIHTNSLQVYGDIVTIGNSVNLTSTYQETANNINYSGSWTNIGNLYDGSWSTFGYSLSGSGKFYANYSYNGVDILDRTSTRWILKDGGTGSQVSLSIPNSCFNGVNVSFKITSEENHDDSGRYYCYNFVNSNYTQLYVSSGGTGYYIYEEAINWSSSDTLPSGGNINISGSLCDSNTGNCYTLQELNSSSGGGGSGSTYNSTYATWAYNMTQPFMDWLSTFVYNYNQTVLSSSYSDGWINNTFYTKTQSDTIYSPKTWAYNMTQPFMDWLSTFIYNYNQTVLQNNFYNSTYATWAYNQTANLTAYAKLDSSNQPFKDNVGTESLNTLQRVAIDNNGNIMIDWSGGATGKLRFNEYTTNGFLKITSPFGDTGTVTIDTNSYALSSSVNASFNQTLTNSLYASKTWNYNQTVTSSGSQNLTNVAFKNESNIFLRNQQIKNLNALLLITDNSTSNSLYLKKQSTSNYAYMYNEISKPSGTAYAVNDSTPTSYGIQVLPTTSRSYLTMGGWFKFPSASAGKGWALIYLGNPGSSGIGVYTDGSGYLGILAGGIVASVSTTQIPANTWFHIILQDDGSNNWNLYLNNNLIKTLNTVNPNTPTDWAWYNQDISGSGGKGGSTDETFMYSRILTSGERADLYNSGTGYYINGNFPSTGTSVLTNALCINHQDDGTGTSAIDSSGNGKTIYWNGGITWIDGKVPSTSSTVNTTILCSSDGTNAAESGINQFNCDTTARTVIDGSYSTFNLAGISTMFLNSTGFMGYNNWITSQNLTSHDINSTGTINAKENYSIKGINGLTKGMTIMKTAITTCDLNFTGGILTSTTC